MQERNVNSNSNKNFIVISAFLIFLTFLSAYYISNLLFYGNNSYEVYLNLVERKLELKNEIKRLQNENAALQKQYFELKNLEPEEL
ncbi:MAG: septum formation initiator [Campylobacterota bacterium]|nr:septum formation initiator [Campylobacterota bacterium]